MRPTAEQLVAELHSNLRQIEEGSDVAAHAVRQGVASELEAINQYEDLAASTSNQKIKSLLSDVADEEKVHQGEFTSALNMLDPDEHKKEKEGEKEAKEKTLGESLRQFHAEFPELLQEGPVMNAVGAGTKTLLQHTPVVGQVMNAFSNAKQTATTTPAQPGTPAPQAQQPQKKGLISRAANMVGDIAGKAAGAYTNAKNQKASTLSNLQTAGKSSEEVLKQVGDAIVAYAKTVANQSTSAAPDKQTEAIRTYNQLLQELTQLDEDDAFKPGSWRSTPAGTPAKTQNDVANERAANIPATQAPNTDQPAPKSTQEPASNTAAPQQPSAGKSPTLQAPVGNKPKDKVNSAAVDFANRIQSNPDWMKDQKMIDGLKTIVQGAKQFKVAIPGLDSFTPEMIDQAAQELITGAQQPAAPSSGADPQQAMTMPVRALGNIVKQVLSKGDDESKQVAAMVMKATSGKST